MHGHHVARLCALHDCCIDDVKVPPSLHQGATMSPRFEMVCGWVLSVIAPQRRSNLDGFEKWFALGCRWCLISNVAVRIREVALAIEIFLCSFCELPSSPGQCRRMLAVKI